MTEEEIKAAYSNVTFGKPDASWNIWQKTARGKPWITSFDDDCYDYNSWRYGVDRLSGYYRYLTHKNSHRLKEAIEKFQHSEITYIAGTDDVQNCKVRTYPHCEDGYISNVCDGMLQGDNR
jgi:hypothetical protein